MMLYALDLLGTLVFAITGVLVACRREMDLFGVLVLAFVTAAGGGTIRDLLLGQSGVFWITDHNYLFVVLFSVVIGLPMRHWWLRSQKFLLVLDAIGLGTFAVIGVQKTLTMGADPMVAVVMGCLTGAAGGAIRDLLTGEVPIILKQDIYATAAIAGGLVYIGLNLTGLPVEWVALSSATVVILCRLAAIQWRLSLPGWKLQD